MNRISAPALKVLIALLVLSLAGCVTYYQPRYADDGVYYGDEYYAGYSRSHVVDPVHYPYWSLDYFYFSYYRHPYSVLYYHDPFFRPYPGWYYGYRPGPRFRFAASFGHWYPWYGAGFYYHYYRPWYWHHHYHYHYHNHARPAVERRQRAVAGGHGDRGRSLYRAQQQDARESFAMSGNRRALRDDGIPWPGDRTPVQSLAPERTHADRRAMARDRATMRTDPAVSTADRRRASPRAQAPERRTDTGSQAPRSRTPAPGTQPRTRPEQRGIPLPQRGSRSQPRRDAAPATGETISPPVRQRQQAPPRVEQPRPESTPPPAPPRDSAPPRESSQPPARARSESDGDRRRPR